MDILVINEFIEVVWEQCNFIDDQYQQNQLY